MDNNGGVQTGEGGEESWGWGEKAENCTCTTIKKMFISKKFEKKKETLLPSSV